MEYTQAHALLDVFMQTMQQISTASCAGAAAGDVIPEAELRALLRLVDLEYLTERPGGLRAVVDWGSQLSLGARPAHGIALRTRVSLCVHRSVHAGVWGAKFSCRLTPCKSPAEFAHTSLENSHFLRTVPAPDMHASLGVCHNLGI